MKLLNTFNPPKQGCHEPAEMQDLGLGSYRILDATSLERSRLGWIGQTGQVGGAPAHGKGLELDDF